MGFTCPFRNLRGKFLIAIATFNFQPRFNFSTAIRYLSSQHAIGIFNAQLRLQLSTAIQFFNAQLNRDSTFQRSSAIATFNRDWTFQRSTAVPTFFLSLSKFQCMTESQAYGLPKIAEQALVRRLLSSAVCIFNVRLYL